MSDAEDISDTDSSNLNYDSYQNPPPPQDGPYLEIVEQPQSRGFRFRYACEGKSHGGLQGVNSRREKKSFPTVRINRFKGPAKIIVSLVMDGKDPKPHAHELIGKNCQNGICSVTIKGENMTVSFPNLGVRHVTKKSVTKILTERIKESMKVERMMSGFLGQDAEHISLSREEEQEAQRQADLQAKTMPLSIVRLRFQAYLQDSKGIYSHVLPPVISNPIYDSKAPCASVLKICRMDKVGGCCTGNEEVFLLCDKVQKDDIAVRFYELDEEGNIKWEAYGNFAPHDVHRQYAIVFRTPCYMETNIDRPVAVHVQLKRFSDNEVSDPKTFTYYPQQTDLEDIQKKRKKQIPHFSDSDVFSTMGGNSINFNNLNNQQGFGGEGRETGGGGGGGTLGGGAGDVIGANSNFISNYWSINSNFNSNLPVSGSNMTQMGTLETDDMLVSRGAPLCPAPFIMKEPIEPFIKREPIEPFIMKEPIEPFIKKEPIEPFIKKEPIDVTIIRPKSPESIVVQRKYVTQPSLVEVDCGEDVEMDGKQKEGHAELEKADATLKKLAHMVAAKTVQMTKCLQSYAVTGDARFLIRPGRSLIPVQNEDGDNCLHLSIIHQQPEAARNLVSIVSTLQDNSLINDCNELLQTPLYLAVATKQIPLQNVLLSHGADCKLQDQHGNTFLHLAARRGYEKCLELFLNNWDHNSGPSVDSLNFEGFSALHLAVFGGHLNCVKLLLSVGGADVNLPDARSGRAALHHAVDTDNLAIVGHLILESGADVNQPAFNGNTALHMAVTSNRLGIAALLMAADADPEAENMDVDSEDDEEEEYNDEKEEDEGDILEDGADVCESKEETDVVGRTPKDIAARNPKMLRILNGEPYSSVSEAVLQPVFAAPETNLPPDVGTRLRSVYDSGISSIGLLSQALSGQSERGDLDELDSMSRTLLAKLLDPVKTGADWRELSRRLGFGSMTNAFQFQSSPTKALLDNFEVVNGTSLTLKRCLLEMGRKDAVQVIEEAIPSKVDS